MMQLFQLITSKAKQLYSKIEDYRYYLTLKKASPELKTERLDQCESCIHMNIDFEIGIFKVKNHSQCDICKCFLDKKTGLYYESCPMGKW